MNEQKQEDDRRPVGRFGMREQGAKTFCQRVKWFRESYKDGSLDGMYLHLVEEHIKECQSCKEHYED